MNRMFSLAAAAVMGVSATAAIAQTGVADANGRIVAQSAAPSPATQMNADLQAQYDADMASYRASLRANNRAARMDRVHYDHQQRAYADAMRAWRDQVYACHHGSTRACNAPTPNPADYY